MIRFNNFKIRYWVGGIECVKDSDGNYWKVQDLENGIRIFGIVKKGKIMAEQTNWNAKDARILYQNAVNRATELAIHCGIKTSLEALPFIKETANELAEFMWNAGTVLGDTGVAPSEDKKEEETKEDTKKTTKKKTTKKTISKRGRPKKKDVEELEDNFLGDSDEGSSEEKQELPVPTATQEKIMNLIASKLEVSLEDIKEGAMEHLGEYPRTKEEAQKLFKEMK